MPTYDFMAFAVKRETSGKGVPYVEARWSYVFDESVEISFRRYPKRTFVAYEDDRGNLSSGVDLDDCYLTPTYIFAKISNYEFEPLPTLYDVICHIFGPPSAWTWRQDEPDFVQDLKQALVWPVRIEKLTLPE
jgi:hypothetical protein